MLFENRLGHTLFRPIGMEWFHNGYWDYPHPDKRWVAEQLLENTALESKSVYYNREYNNFTKIKEISHNYITLRDMKNEADYKCLTFEQFKNTKIDVVIASVPQHEITFSKLIKDHKPDTKLILHEGNSHVKSVGTIAKNIMISVPEIDYTFPEGSLIVYAHQEFDLDIFRHTKLYRHNRIISLINCLHLWKDAHDLWDKYKVLLPEYEWRMHGQDGEDGVIDNINGIAEALMNTSFVFHPKPQAVIGGHNLLNAMACGRPIITRGADIGGEMKGKLIDNYNIIDLDIGNPEERIRSITSDKLQEMSENIYATFKKLVDFEQESESVRQFMDNLR